jgi:proteic killer suppression protein
MIKGFKNKGLRELFEDGTTGKVRKDLQDRCLRRLDALHHAKRLDELRVPGFDFHALKGGSVKRYTIHVNGPWCITFEFEDGDAHHVDLEQYH